MLEYKHQFKKLAPQWYEELDEPHLIHNKTKNIILDIESYQCCIVGEIHGFSDNYARQGNNNYCLDCYDLSREMAFELTLNRDNFMIDELIDHINKDHPKLMKGKKC